jgi:diguanylate cyclase (GGDEF)-like protein/PAS domain S-box-containing protein
MLENLTPTTPTAACEAELAPLLPTEILRLMDTSLGATVSVMDRSLRFRYVNAGFAQAFNLTWQEMMSMSLYEVYPAVELATFMPYVERVLLGESVTYERLGRIHHHESVWRTVSMNPWRDGTGAVVGIVHCSLAVHELKAATEALRVANERLRILALHDQLTGLPNRMALNARLADSLKRASRSQDPVALLFIDLDGFKQVNDEFGHAAGDEVLREVAKRLLLAVRSTDVVARYGGDEFVVLLDTEVRDDTPDRVCQRIFAQLQAPCVFPQGEAQIGASIGISQHPPLPNRADEMLERADAAMFAAKRAGKGCVRVAGA